MQLMDRSCKNRVRNFKNGYQIKLQKKNEAKDKHQKENCFGQFLRITKRKGKEQN